MDIFVINASKFGIVLDIASKGHIFVDNIQLYDNIEHDNIHNIRGI